MPAAASDTHGHALTAEDAGAWLDGFMPNALRQADIAGAVVSIVKDGATLVERGYGYADVQKETPMDPAGTLVRPGSISTQTSISTSISRSPTVTASPSRCATS